MTKQDNYHSLELLFVEDTLSRSRSRGFATRSRGFVTRSRGFVIRAPNHALNISASATKKPRI